MVCYSEKHNEANGEGNRDGDNRNHSRNYGAEGPTEDHAVNTLRRKQVKNFMAILMLSQGVPMILAGDEILRSQQGNNNCYCQDNELSWIDWNLLEENREMFLFTRAMIRLRKRHPCLMQRQFLSGAVSEASGIKDIAWHGTKLNMPKWNDATSCVLACTLSRVEPQEEDLHIMLNMSQEDLSMELPGLQAGGWYLAMDTANGIDKDIIEPERQAIISSKTVLVHSHSVVVCESR
jgi:glycogen operon protein